MTNEDKGTDWIKMTKGHPDDAPVKLDPNDCKIVANTNSKLIKAVEKILASNQEHIKVVTYGFAIAYLLIEGTKHGKKEKEIFFNKIFSVCKYLCVRLCKTIPDAIEKHRQVSQQRYHNEGGKTAALRASHKRKKPIFHWQCAVCESTMNYSQEQFVVRSQHWKNLFVGNAAGPIIKRYPKFKELLIQKFGKENVHVNGDNSLVDVFWQTWIESEYYKPSHHKKFPSKDESIKSHIADKVRKELKDDGIVEKKKRQYTSDEDNKIITLRHFMSQNVPPGNKSAKDAWIAVAKMMGYSPDEWEELRNEIKEYCEENKIPFDKVEKPKYYDAGSEHKKHDNDDNNKKSAI